MKHVYRIWAVFFVSWVGYHVVTGMTETGAKVAIISAMMGVVMKLITAPRDQEQ